MFDGAPCCGAVAVSRHLEWIATLLRCLWVAGKRHVRRRFAVWRGRVPLWLFQRVVFGKSPPCVLTPCFGHPAVKEFAVKSTSFFFVWSKAEERGLLPMSWQSGLVCVL